MNTDPSNTAAFDALVEQLKCPVCKELLKEPFVTGCGHTFCHGCIKHHLQTTSQRCPCCGTYMITDQVTPVFALDKVRHCSGSSTVICMVAKETCTPVDTDIVQVLVAARRMAEARSSSGAQLASFLSDTPAIQTCQEVDGLIDVLNQRRSELERNHVTAQLQLLYLFLDHVRCAACIPLSSLQVCIPPMFSHWTVHRHMAAADVVRNQNCQRAVDGSA